MRGFAGLTIQHQLAASAAAIVMAVSASPAMAQTRTFDVPAGAAPVSLPAIAKQAGIQILASGDTVKSKRTNAVRGVYSVEEALRVLLKGTGLKANASRDDVITITAVDEKKLGPRPQIGDGKIEDIIVTARYFSERVHDTPMAITAQTGAQLDAANVTNIGTLGAVVPNLWTVPGDSRSAGTPKVTLRGVVQGDSSSYAAPPAIAIYTDDVYHATTAGSELDFIDVDHIEIARGPQSTLSGNASIGGSIKMYSKDPVGDGSGYFSLTAGSRNKMGAEGAVDVKLSSTLAVRIAGKLERQNGWFDRLDFTCEMNKLGTPQLAGNFPLFSPTSPANNCVIGKLGGIDHAIGQAKLSWRPNDKFDVLLTVRQREENDEETPELALAYQPNGTPNSNDVVEVYNKAVRETYGLQLDSRFLPPASDPQATYATNCRPNLPLSGTYPAVDGVYVPSGFCYPQGKTASHTLMSGRARYEFANDVRMTAIAAFTKYGNAFTAAGDQSPLGYTVSHFENRARQLSGELRFDGKTFGDKLSWVAGAFLMRTTGYQDSFIGFISSNSFVKDKAEIESGSGFFHLDYNVTDAWRFSGGARYTEGQISYHFDHPPLLTLPNPFTVNQKRWDWLLSTDYKITGNILAYANAATGSRPPGVVTVINSAQQFLDTPGEELISYETGLKTNLLDRRLRMNLAAFYTDYKSLGTQVRGFQCLGELPNATWFAQSSSCDQFADKSFLGWNLPIGHSATVKGVEWEITARPVDALSLEWSGGYNNYESGVKTPGQPGYLWPGNHRQPVWNMHADAAYDIDTSFGIVTPRLDWTWQSQQDFDTTSSVRAPLPVFIEPAYSLWNAQMGYKSFVRNWSAIFAVKNVADTFHSYLKLNGTVNAQARVAPPREVSLTLRRDF